MIRGTELLEALPVAVYTTDADGRIPFYNRAAAELWGHHPELGSSQWCGSWRLYWPDGRPLPHGECPMAIEFDGGGMRSCRAGRDARARKTADRGVKLRRGSARRQSRWPAGRRACDLADTEKPSVRIRDRIRTRGFAIRIPRGGRARQAVRRRSAARDGRSLALSASQR